MRWILSFFAGTLVLSWAAFGLAVAIADEHSSNALAVTALGLLGTFAPAGVALVLSLVQGGRRMARALLQKVLEFAVPWRWYAFALGYLAAVKLAAAVVYWLLLGYWPAFGNVSAAVAISILVATPLQLGEELGWRGYALPRLAKCVGYPFAGVVLGLFLGLWHLPLFFMPGSSNLGQAFWWFAFGGIALSVAMTWLYVNTRGSVLLAMLMHSAVNHTNQIVPTRVEGATTPFDLVASPIILASAGVMLATSVYLLWRLRADRSPHPKG
jgi:uncharacterized protein